MVKVKYNDQLVYKVVIWAFFGISLWTEKVALNRNTYSLLRNVEHSLGLSAECDSYMDSK